MIEAKGLDAIWGHVASALTIMFSFIGLTFEGLNQLLGQYQPTINAIGVLGGLAMTFYLYFIRPKRKQRAKDRADE